MSDQNIPEQPESAARGCVQRVVRTPGYREPQISIDRMSKSVAVFDGFKCVRPFEKYTTEEAALKDAHEWLKDKTIHVPQVIYPMVRKMKVS